MDLRPEEHEALVRLARRGALPLGQGSDCIPTEAAMSLAFAGFARVADGDGPIAIAITSRGKAFAHRGVR